MKLYTDLTLSRLFVLFSIVLSNNAMDKQRVLPQSPIFTKDRTLPQSPISMEEHVLPKSPISIYNLKKTPGVTVKYKAPESLQSRSQSFVDTTNKLLLLCNHSGSVVGRLTYNQVQQFSFLKNLIDYEKTESEYCCDDSVGNKTIKLFAQCIQACSDKKNSSKVEKIVSKEFNAVSSVLSLSEKLQTDYLSTIVRKILVTKLLQNKESKHITSEEVERLIEKHKLGNRFILMNDRFVTSPLLYYNERFSLAQEKTIVDVTLSPDLKHMVVISDKDLECKNSETCNKYLIAFYKCCNDAKDRKTFYNCKGKDSILFTPDSKYCLMCSQDEFKMIDCSTFAIAKICKGNKEDTFNYFVMSPNGNFLIVTTQSGLGILYKRSQETGLFEITDMLYTISEKSIQPVFTHDSKAFFVSENATLYKYDCQAGTELLKTNFDTTIEKIAINPKGAGIAVCVQGKCHMYYGENLNKLLVTMSVEKDVTTTGFYSNDGSLFALITGSYCFIYGYDNDNKFVRLQDYKGNSFITHGQFFGEDSTYLMLSDYVTCDIYDCCNKTLLKDINLHCFEGANIVVSKDGSHLIVTCKNTSTIYGAYPLKDFLKLMSTVLKK